MKLSALLFGCVVCFSGHVCAADWVALDEGDYYVDMSRIDHVPTGDRTVWLRYSLNPRSVAALQKNNPSRTYGQYGYTLAKYQVDCRRKRMGFMQFVHYGVDGFQIESLRSSEPPEMDEVIPDSAGSAILATLCSHLDRQ